VAFGFHLAEVCWHRSQYMHSPRCRARAGPFFRRAQVFNTVELQVNNAGDDESSGVPPAILGLVDPPHPRFSALRACIRRRDYFAREVAETLSPSRDVVNIDVYTDLGYRVHALFPGSSHALHFVSEYVCCNRCGLHTWDPDSPHSCCFVVLFVVAPSFPPATPSPSCFKPFD